MNELARILAIPAADRTDADKAYLDAHASELSDDQRAALEAENAGGDQGDGSGAADDQGAGAAGAGDGSGDGQEGAEEKALRELIQKDIQETVGKKVDALADRLVEKFMSGASEARKKALLNPAKKVEAGAEVKKFFKGLLSGDESAIRALANGYATSHKGLTTGVNADGGYLVPTVLTNEIVRIANDTYGVARRDMRYIPISGPGNSFPIPNVASGITTYWTDEGVKKKSAKPQFGLLTLTLKKLAVIVPMTDEFLEDTIGDITQLIADLVAESMAMEEDIQFFTGTGTIFTGIVNNSNVLVVTLPTGTGPSEITADSFLDMINKAPASIRKTGKFYLSSSVLAVIQKLKDVTSGQYIWSNPRDGSPGTIWGRPYEIVDAMADITTVDPGEAFVIFTDLKKTAIFADKKQIRVKVLDQATITDTDGSTTLNLAQQDMTALRFMERVGFVLALPGGVVVLKVSSTGS